MKGATNGAAPTSSEGDSEDFGSSSDSGGEAQEQRPLAKRRRTDASHTLGLELVTKGLRRGGGSLQPAAAADQLDAQEEAEASLLQLEVGDLLQEARPDPAAEPELLDLLHSLAALLGAMPEAEVAWSGGEADAIRGFLDDLAFQPPRPFRFQPPSRCQVVGSFALGAAVRPSPCVDLALLMPAACFDSKDQLNHRYLAKRALYLAHVAAALRGHPQLSGTAWTCLASDPRRPVLLLHPRPGLSPAGFVVRLLPAAPLELCPLARLGPARNNLRSAAAAPQQPRQGTPAQSGAAAAHGQGAKASGRGKAAQAGAGGASAAADAQLAPTPHYNTSVLQDLLMLPLAEQFRETAAACPHLGNAAALLRLWAAAQRADQGADGLSGTFLTALLVHVVEGSPAVAGMTAIHLFRSVLVALADPKTFSPALLMRRRDTPGSGASRSADAAQQPPEAKAWRRTFDLALVDASGWLNLAAGVSRAAAAAARDAAARTLQLLNGGTPDAFAAAFLTPQPRAALCDYWFHVRMPPAPDGGAQAGAAQQNGGQGRCGDLLRDQPSWRLEEQRVESLAARALGTRARLVRVFRRTLQDSHQQQGQQQQRQGEPLRRGVLRPAEAHILLGVRVDPTAALRTLDVGPAADSGEAARTFRAFWGDKAELRRFQDGLIAEAVVWEAGPAQRHLIVDSIVSHALRRHLPAGASVACLAGCLDDALRRKHSTPEADAAAAKLCEAAAERLGKRLRSLPSDALPLRVMSVQPLAAVLRHAAAFPPLPQLLAGAPAGAASEHAARCLQPVELLCQLEGSGKWPDHPEAFQKMRAAVGCQLAQQLHTALGVEAQASEEWVDVLTDGFAFRLLLATERDEAMRQRQAQLEGEAQPPAAGDAALRSWLQGAVMGVAGENPGFEPALRLAKRWVGAQLLSPHLGEEAVELLVAHCFCAAGRPAGDARGGAATAPSAAAPPPASRLSGLLRFLHLLAHHPWRVAPLVVDPNGEMGPAQRDAAVRAHAAARAAGAAPALCLVTPRDPRGGAWTAAAPSPQMLHRIAVLAGRAAAALEAHLLGAAPAAAAGHSGDGGGKSLSSPVPAEGRPADGAAAAAVFSSDLGEYDVLLRLRPDALPNAANRLRLGGGERGGERGGEHGARPALGPALRAVGERLAAEAAEAAGCKLSRAVLKGIPQSVLASRSHAALRRELLVGFDPLPRFTAALQARLGDAAVACADYVGGSLVALRWRAASLAPAPLRPDAAHLVCPAGSPEAAAAGELAARGRPTPAAAAGSPAGKWEGLAAAAVVLDVAAALSDVVQLGRGLVEGVELL